MEINGHRILLPEAKSFADVFAFTSPSKGEIEPTLFDHVDWIGAIGRRTVPKGQVELGPYCSIRLQSGRGALYVQPTRAVIAAIQAGHVGGYEDPLTFEVIEWSSGEKLVLSKNTRILASRWIAVLPPEAEVPEFDRW